MHEIECDSKFALKQQIEELKRRFDECIKKCDALRLTNNDLANEIMCINSLNNTLNERLDAKDRVISNMKLKQDALISDCANVNSQKSWGRDKWVEDTVINDYFLAMAENVSLNGILFLGPSATQIVRFATPDSALESLNLTSGKSYEYILLCVSDCADASKEDGGSHWSLLFLNKYDKSAYHFDSMIPMNKLSAQIIARNLGIKNENVFEMPCIQQKLSFECGIHVLANAKFVAHHYCLNEGKNTSFTDWFSGASNSNVLTPIINQPRHTFHNHNKKEKTKLLAKKKPTVWHVASSKRKTVKNKNIFKHSAQRIELKNRFEVLDIDNKELNKTKTLFKNNNKNIATSQEKLITNSRQTHKMTLPKHKLSCIRDFKIKVVSDSQGRGLSNYLSYSNNGEYEIINHCQPGAPIQPLINSLKNSPDFKTLSKSDCVVVIGGTNNISHLAAENTNTFVNTLTTFLADEMSCFKHTNLILGTIPYRYDLSSSSPENKLIKDINLIIRQIVYNNSHVQLLDLYLLQSCYHTRHGLHVNKRGKKLISTEIMKMAEKVRQIWNNNSTSNVQPEMVCQKSPLLGITCDINYASSSFDGNAADETTLIEPIQRIQIVEEDMENLITNNQSNPYVAFAHCISGDFGDQRQMSAGVAVTFRKIFKRPKRTDCITDYLTLQQVENQAAVYGLVTKPTYSSKPTIDDYNQAFCHLISDFKNRNFKKLICSPMGCMRDQINPQLFAKNIVHFQGETSSPVVIALRDERASRTLRNGLKHQEFVDLLRNLISEAQNLSDTLPSAPALSLHDLHPSTATTSEEAQVNSELSSVQQSNNQDICRLPSSSVNPGRTSLTASSRRLPGILHNLPCASDNLQTSLLIPTDQPTGLHQATATLDSCTSHQGVYCSVNSDSNTSVVLQDLQQFPPLIPSGQQHLGCNNTNIPINNTITHMNLDFLDHAQSVQRLA